MTNTQIQSRIARCIEIKRLIAEFEAELKMHKETLVAEAATRDEEHAPTDGGGWSWRHHDVPGNEVCVTQPARKLRATLNPESRGFDKIRELAGRRFPELFLQVPAYKPVEEFQVRALAALPQTDAKRLIKLVTTEATPTVSFEVAAARELA